MHTSTLPAPARPAPAPPPAPGRHRTATPSRPRWERPALLALLAGTALLYLWGLSASGYANDFYAAAVQAGTQSWKAWLFGSLDSGNAITVDKPPAALWVMVASARLFGFNSWSLLVPQALMGVASVALLRAAVRRWAGPGAGLLAGAVLALTPAAVLMFRFDNPDALLVLLLVSGAYATVRAIDAASVRASTWWLVAAGAAVGFGFLTKMGQALLVVPAFGLAYLVAGPTPVRTRLLQLLAALGSMVVSAGWFVALVELWPADSRPYIGGSTTNSLLELALGYNGLGRLPRRERQRRRRWCGGANSGFGGAAGITRLFTDELGLEISWLLPAALVALVALVAISWRAPRRRSAAGRGPALGRLDAGHRPGLQLHERHDAPVLHGRPRARDRGARGRRRGGAVGAADVGGGPRDPGADGRGDRGVELRAAGRLDRVVHVGPVGRRRRRRAGGGRAPGRRRAVAPRGDRGDRGGAAHRPGRDQRVRRRDGLGRAHGQHPERGHEQRDDGRPGRWRAAGVAVGCPDRRRHDRRDGTTGDERTTDAAPADGFSADGGQPQGGGMGVSANSELTALLTATDGTWSAAVSSSQSAASLELASGTAVMSTGGWGGSDAAVTLEQFQAYVADGQITYYVGGGQGGGPGGDSDSTSSQIAAWVAANYTATTVGGQTVYDLQA